MKPELFDAAHEIVLTMVNASAVDDKRAQWAAYQELVELCESSESAGNQHPFQWETLGDFTADKAIAMRFYEKALGYAEAAGLDEYIASISLAMAEAFLVLGDTARANALAIHANEAAMRTDDLELKENVSELIRSLPGLRPD